MKNLFLPYLFIIIFFCMLTNSSSTFEGARNGLELWLFTVVPSLLPYMIISTYMTESGIFQFLSRFFSAITKYLYHLSPNCGYVIFLGFLCGYPIGSKLSADMVKKGHISLTEGQILLCFCNNVSPAFLITYLNDQVINLPQYATKIMAMMITVPVVSGLVFSWFYRHFPLSEQGSVKVSANSNHSVHSANLDACITLGFENIFRLGGYILLFSIANQFIIDFFRTTPLMQSRICSLLEITSGLDLYRENMLTSTQRLLECTSLCSFGGFCCLAQTASMIRGSGLRLSHYIIAKIFLALFTYIVAFVFFL